MSSSFGKKSTIVRARKALGYGSVRTAFRILEHTAPPLGARWAERVWLKVPPRAWRPATPVPVPTGDPFTLTVGVSTVRGDSWGEGPAVYLLHGWGGTRRQLDAFVRPLLDAGFRVVSFDAPGHGESTQSLAGPRRSTLPEFTDALTVAAHRFGDAHAVIAHSFGSAAAVLAVLDGVPVQRLAAIAPVGDPIGFSYGFAAMLGFGERIRTGFLRVLEKRVGRPMADFDVPKRLAETPPRVLPPLLVVHDMKDREVPVRSGQDLARAWRGSEFRTTTGLGHNRILVDPDTVELVTAFVAKSPALVGSGPGSAAEPPVSSEPRTPPAP